MLQLISLVIIYGAMMFIWTFVYLNRSRDQINQAFLIFLSNILIWMILNSLDEYCTTSGFGIAMKTIYWLSMMFLSITFLFFCYRLLKKKIDWLFYVCLGVNTLVVCVRYLYPMDYSDPSFWRLTEPIIAPLMSLAFSLPAIYALYLVLRQMIATKDARQRLQLSFILYGIGLALLVSVFSEYFLPTVLHVTEKLYLMYYAIAIFVVAIFVSIMRYRLLSLRSDYIYQKLFINASECVLIVNKTGHIVSVNNVAKEILQDENLDAGDRVSDYLPGYRFEEDYKHHEVTLMRGEQPRYLTMTQYPMDESGLDSAKLLLLTDQTQERLRLEREKEQLLEKTNFDQLTGLYNKRYLKEKYQSVSSDATKKRALLFIDIDDFKLINSKYGHLVGDEVLCEFAACLKNTVRSTNEAVRFGGDEFVIILENTSAEDAFLIAERIRSCAGALTFSSGGETFHITLSIGLIEGTSPINELIEKADRAMYSSKDNGKNRTTLFSEDVTTGESGFHIKLF